MRQQYRTNGYGDIETPLPMFPGAIIDIPEIGMFQVAGIQGNEVTLREHSPMAIRVILLAEVGA